jgi:hypothetical protein
MPRAVIVVSRYYSCPAGFIDFVKTAAPQFAPHPCGGDQLLDDSQRRLSVVVRRDVQRNEPLPGFAHLQPRLVQQRQRVHAPGNCDGNHRVVGNRSRHRCAHRGDDVHRSSGRIEVDRHRGLGW